MPNLLYMTLWQLTLHLLVKMQFIAPLRKTMLIGVSWSASTYRRNSLRLDLYILFIVP